MNEYRQLFSLNWTQKFLWWCSGADIKLLTQCPTDWQKFNTIGISIVLTSILAVISFVALGINIISNLYLTIGLGIFWGANIFFLNRIIASVFPTHKILSNILILLPRIFLALMISFTLSFPIQIVLFQDSIEIHSHLSKIVSTNRFIEMTIAFNELRNSSVIVNIFSWLIFILFFFIELTPILISWFTSRGAYVELLLFEVEKRKLESKSELALLTYKYKNKLEKREELYQMPLGGFEIYIDYKKLLVNDVDSLLKILSKIYGLVYGIVSVPENTFKTNDFLLEVENIIKSHPEDILLVHSIETGNSLTFKISTGWKPNVELTQGEIIISLPKGALALLITAYLVSKVFEFGVSNYKQLIEIEKLKNENKIIESQLLQEHLSSFNDRLNKSSDSIKLNFQEELFKLHNSTLNNSNFNNITITQDKSIIEKMKTISNKSLKE